MLGRIGLKKCFARTITFNSTDPKIGLNWRLAKLLITPRNEVNINTSISGTQGSANSIQIVGDKVKWPLPMHIALAKSISSSSAVFIEEGEVNGVSARVISGESDLAAQGRAVLTAGTSFSESNGISVLLTSDVDFEGKLYFDKTKKLAIGNHISQADFTEILNNM
jgi:hypothetical protein